MKYVDDVYLDVEEYNALKRRAAQAYALEIRNRVRHHYGTERRTKDGKVWAQAMDLLGVMGDSIRGLTEQQLEDNPAIAAVVERRTSMVNDAREAFPERAWVIDILGEYPTDTDTTDTWLFWAYTAERLTTHEEMR